MVENARAMTVSNASSDAWLLCGFERFLAENLRPDPPFVR